MGEGLGRSVLARNRFARMWGLGDRKNPQAHTPSLILLEGDPEVDATLAPFSSTSTTSIPSKLTLKGRLPLCPPDFKSVGPYYEVSVGHVLPPSLEEADAGEAAGCGGARDEGGERGRRGRGGRGGGGAGSDVGAAQVVAGGRRGEVRFFMTHFAM